MFQKWYLLYDFIMPSESKIEYTFPQANQMSWPNVKQTYPYFELALRW